MNKNIKKYKEPINDSKRNIPAFENSLHADNEEEYVKAQIQLNNFSNQFKSESDSCWAAQRKSKHPYICEHGLFDQPLYRSINTLSGMLAVKLHHSQEEIEKGIQLLNENIGQSYCLRFTKNIPELFLAQLYINRQYVRQDYSKAKDILHNIIANRYPDNYALAMYLLGTMYQKGLGMKKNRKTATDYFNVACLLQNENACYALKETLNKH